MARTPQLKFYPVIVVFHRHFRLLTHDDFGEEFFNSIVEVHSRSQNILSDELILAFILISFYEVI